MYSVNGTVGGEPTLTGSIHDVRGLLIGIWPDDPVTQRPGQRLPNGLHLRKSAQCFKVHTPIVTVISGACVAHRYVFLAPVRFAS